jgi:predicted  nucleic acid-binding Zn-ribbon protein
MEAEVVKITLMVANLVVSFVMGGGLFWLGTKTRRFESTENRLHETATKLVDERFRATSHELKGSMQGLLLTMEEMKNQIRDGQSEYRGLGDRDQKIELQLAGKVDQIKDYIREHAATKNDLEAHESSMERKIEKIESQIAELSKQVAVFSDRMSKGVA